MNLEYILPFALLAALTFFVSYNLFNKRLNRQEKRVNNQIVIPLRLQAYERMTLFLERITPNNLVLRLMPMAQNSLEFQHSMLQEIREEFNHNLAQQIYVSPQVWEDIKIAMNQVVATINITATELDPNSSSIELSKKILEKVMTENNHATSHVIAKLKEEAQALF